MSVSGFHHHFKAVTAMSPLQFQKQLRLQEARRLMLSEDFDAASAAYRVGYHVPPTSIGSTKASSASHRCATCNGCGKRPWLSLANKPAGPSDTVHDLPHAAGYCLRCANNVGLVFFIGTSRKSDLIYLFKRIVIKEAVSF